MTTIKKLVAAFGLDAKGEVAMRDFMVEYDIRENDRDVLAALAIARVDGSLRRNNELIQSLDQRLRAVEIALKNG